MAASVFGTLVVIKRNGQDGSRFPLKTTKCVIGRSADSDVRLQLPTVSLQHCRIDVLDDGQITLVNLAKTNHTELNGEPVTTSEIVGHGSLFSVADRTFRWEFPKSSPFFERFVARSSPKGMASSRRNFTSVGTSDDKSFTSTKDDTCSKPPNNDVENTNSPPKPLKRRKSSKDKNTIGLSPGTEWLSASLSKQSYSHLTTNEFLSLKKVSFGPSLSPEQFGNGLPSATPIKKGGRPPSRRPSMPDYYGNPILTPVISVSRDSSSRNSKTSRKSVSFKETAKSPLVQENMLKSTPIIELRKACKIERPASKSTSPKSNIVRLSLKSRSMSAPAKSKGKAIRTLLGLDNAVKVVAPSSLDSKKSAALRTIHAGKLKLNKSKSSSEPGRRSTRPLKALKIQIPFKSKSTEKKGLKSFSTMSSPKRNRSTASPSSVSSIWYDTHSNVSPNVPTEMFVSPLCTPGSSVKKRSSSIVKRFFRQNEKTKRSMRTKNSLNMSGMPRVLRTLSTCRNPLSDNILNSIASNKSPIPDYTDVTGLRRLFKSPRKSPISNYSDVHGLKRLLRTPAKSPKADYMNVDGVKRLLRGSQKSPKSEYTDVFGLKRLLRSPQISPTSDYSNLHGLKRLLKTPGKSPKGNYLNDDGVAELFQLRQSPRSLENVLIKTLKVSEGTTNAIMPVRALRSISRLPKTPTNATVSPKLSGKSFILDTPRVGSPSDTVTLCAGAKPCQKRRKIKLRNSFSPIITTRTLRSSARKKSMPRMSPNSSLLNTPLHGLRSSCRKLKSKVMRESPLNNRKRTSPATQPLLSNNKSKRKGMVTKDNEISPPLEPVAMLRTRKATTKSLKIVSSLPVNSPEDENTPLRKTRSTKKGKKRLETKDLKSSESPVTFGRITRASRRRLVTGKSPLGTGSPKLFPKNTADRSPEIQPLTGRILRRRAK